jgi:aconitate decarboxylase
MTNSQSATDPKGTTGILATWLADLNLKEVPDRVRERAKYLTLDGLGCAIVGAKLPWSRVAVEAVLDLEGEGNNTIIGWGRKGSAPVAALLNGTFIQGFELDDVHYLGPLHSASVVVPSLLACAEKIGNISGAQFLEGAVAGYEVGPRVGMALHGGEMLARGWHSGSVFGTHSSAAAAGKLLNLDASKYEDALGLAGTQSAGLMAAQYEAMCKRMHHGFSSRNGLYSAFLAARGYTGIKRVFERPYGGFLSTFGEGHSPDASQISQDLGEIWQLENIVIKPYATMGGFHAVLDCLLEMAEEKPLHAGEIANLEIELSEAVYHHGWWVPERPLSPIGAQMNVGFAAAVTILDGKALVNQFSPLRINQDDVWELIPKIKVIHNPDFDKSPPEMRARTNLRIEFTDGSRRESSRMMPRTLEQPLSNQEIVEKYKSLTDGLITSQRQQAIVQKITELEKLADINELIELLADPVETLFD